MKFMKYIQRIHVLRINDVIYIYDVFLLGLLPGDLCFVISLTFDLSCLSVCLSQKKVPVSRAPGLLSSVMSLVSSSSPLPTMLEQHKKEFPWLAYSLMSAETRFLQESGVLQVVSQELHTNPSMTTDQALKV